jgi:hypothetical protein
MRSRSKEKDRAVELRKKGLSYNEILKQVPVAKSSLSVWLKDLPLTKSEKAVLRKRKDSNISRGRIKAASVLRQARLGREDLIFAEAKEEFKKYINYPLFAAGLALYWAEGSKRSNQFHFSNSDPDMILIMMVWIAEFIGVPREELGFRLYMHKPYAHENWEGWWAKYLNVPIGNFKKTIFKPTGLLVKKRPNYKGCIRIEMRKSTAAFKKILFWKQMFVEHYR